MMLRKTQSHGQIGEASVAAKCWMHGIPAYNTGGLRANCAGSDLIVDTVDPKTKLMIQVKAGYNPGASQVYLTQCQGDEELRSDKFVSDFVVFVNIDRKRHRGLRLSRTAEEAVRPARRQGPGGAQETRCAPHRHAGGVLE